MIALWLSLALAGPAPTPILHGSTLPPEVEEALEGVGVVGRRAALVGSLEADLEVAGLQADDPELGERLHVDRAGRAEVARVEAALALATRALDAGDRDEAERFLEVAELAAVGAEIFGVEAPSSSPLRLRLVLVRALRWGLALSPVILLFGWTRWRRRRPPRLENPFVTGSPIRDGRLFFGRDALVEKLLDELADGRSWTLTGERRIGKTSLGLQVGAAWEGRGGVTVFVDLEGTDGPVAELQEALEQRARRLGLEVPERLTDLARSLARHGPLLLLLDEVDTLHRRPEPELRQLRRLLTGPSPPAVALLSGVGLAAERLGVPLQVLEVPPLDRRFARTLLEEPLRGQARFEPGALELAIDLADGRPMRVQLLGLFLVSHLNRLDERTVGVAEVRAVEGRLEASWAAIQQAAVVTGRPTEHLEQLESEILALAGERA